MKISVIIPTYNEADFITETIQKVRNRGKQFVHEIIVADGGSTDQTLKKAAAAGARITESSQKGRAAQMNCGARHAKEEILYFLHADTLPPHGFDGAITQAIQRGYDAGCFRLAFDRMHRGLQFYCWFARFNINGFRFGDQSLFVKRPLFNELKGFREDHRVMEGQEIVRRIGRKGSFILLDDTVITSARKYRRYGVLRLQSIYLLIFCLYYLGLPQQKLAAIYGWLTVEG